MSTETTSDALVSRSFRVCSVGAVFALALSLFSARPAHADDWQRERALGDEAIAKKDYATAIRHYRLIAPTRDPGIELQLCECHLHLGDLLAAEKACSQYLAGAKERPHVSPQHTDRAQKYLEKIRQAQTLQTPQTPPEPPKKIGEVPATVDPANGVSQNTLLPNASPSSEAVPTDIKNVLPVVPAPATPAAAPQPETGNLFARSFHRGVLQPSSQIQWEQEYRGRNTGLWSAGLTLWLSSYAAAAAIGLQAGFRARAAEEGLAPEDAHYHFWLAAPVVGPFVSGAMRPIQHPDNQTYWLLNWTIPWIVADGLSQLAGMIMLATGAHPRSTTAQIMRSLRMTPAPTGGHVFLQTTF